MVRQGCAGIEAPKGGLARVMGMTGRGCTDAGHLPRPKKTAAPESSLIRPFNRNGARSGDRTHMPSLATGFESVASASSAIRAQHGIDYSKSGQRVLPSSRPSRSLRSDHCEVSDSLTSISLSVSL